MRLSSWRLEQGYVHALSTSSTSQHLATSEIHLWPETSEQGLVPTSSQGARIVGVHSEFDHALFIFNRTWGSSLVHCLLAMHIDNGLAGSNSDDFLSFIKSEINKQFGIKDLGPLKTFVGIQFERDHLAWEIWIHQEMYIDSLLAEHDLMSCNAIITPLDPSFPLGCEEATYPVVDNLTHAFQHLIGSLLFLQLCL